MPELPLDTLCECSHALAQHHISWFAATGQRIVEECEDFLWADAPKWDGCEHFVKMEVGTDA